MLIQRSGTPNGTNPPNGFAPPTWVTLPPPVQSLSIPSWPLARPSAANLITLHPQTYSTGHNDVEADDSRVPTTYTSQNTPFDFGWDLEHPKRDVRVEKAILVEKACVTNAEFLSFYTAQTNGSSSSSSYTYPLPASWVSEKPGDIQVRTLYGFVPISVAGDWPFVGSFDELEAFAAAKGGRMPTEVELRAFLDGWMEDGASGPVGFREWTFTR